MHKLQLLSALLCNPRARALPDRQKFGGIAGDEADLILMGYGTNHQVGAISDSVGYGAGYGTGYNVGAISDSVGYGNQYEDDGELEHVGYDNLGAPLFRPAQRAQRAPAPPPRGFRSSAHPAPSRARAIAQGAMPSSSQIVSRVYSALPGIPSEGSLMQPMPILNSAFTATSGTTLAINAAPTKGFRPRRVVYVETRTGTSATGLVSLNALAVGTRLQSVTAGNLAAGQYAPTAFDTDVKWDDLQPGVPLTGNVIISAAPTMTDRVDFSLSVNGETLS